LRFEKGKAMNPYPEVVAKIAGDYMERVKSQLRLVSTQEQGDFLREIESHLYEAYQQMPGEDDVARILAVLRNFGEPAEVVSDRLPGALVRSGTKRNLPLYVAGGILIALFGLPLGSAGAGVLVGWTETGTRPQFDIVTGISTGALIAPFAFLGTGYDAALKEAYPCT